MSYDGQKKRRWVLSARLIPAVKWGVIGFVVVTPITVFVALALSGAGGRTIPAIVVAAIVLGGPTLIGVAIGYMRFRESWPGHPRGHCRSCGYNLTGNTSGRCPECSASFEGPEE